MRVLVTGAHGLIGSACLVRLNRDGHELTAAGRALDER
ncbi:MAG TPA: NAD-dependent epimerase/dehydratase family protein [Xanthobacteraceae bacterium]|nr:NAD-dependent epimerase/dehydratase family protein [Xanthobacteraceae bacterium]